MKLSKVEEILYDLVEKIEVHKEFLFIIHEITSDNLILIDVLDYDTEDAIDGGLFSGIESINFMKSYLRKQYANDHRNSC